MVIILALLLGCSDVSEEAEVELCLVGVQRV